MRTTIDRAGRLVVPKALRDRLDLGDGGVVEIIEQGGVIEIHPAPAQVEVLDGPHGPVARPVEDLPPLTGTDVREAIERLRR
jgi:AbrB family looped-hinge helix DNA binding protein